MKNLIRTLLFLLPLSLLAETIIPAGVIDFDVHWTTAGSPYILNGTVSVYGNINPTLTIDPGVEVRFAPNASLRIGRNVYSYSSIWRGNLVALGTALDPIVFRADSGVIGSWSGIEMWHSANTGFPFQTMSHCQIREAENGLFFGGLGSASLFSDVSIVDSAEEGVIYSRCINGPDLDGMTVTGYGTYPVRLSGSALPMLGSFSYSSGPESRFVISGRFTDSVSLDLASYGEAVVFEGDVDVYDANNPRLEILAGSQLDFLSNARLRIGNNTISENAIWRGSLSIQGTALDPVILRADNGVEGSWKGLEFWSSTDLDTTFSSISHCIIQDADYGMYCAGTDQPSIVTALEIQNCEGAGLRFDRCYPTPSLNEMSVSGCSIPVSLEGSAPPVLGNFSHSGNDLERFEVSARFTEDAHYDLLSYPETIVFSGNVDVYNSSNPVLSFAAGSELRFLSNSRLRIGNNTLSENSVWRGRLDIQGTALDPVILRADDGVAGSWKGLEFWGSTDLDSTFSTISHCRIQEADYGIYCGGTSEPSVITALEIQNCEGAGLRFDRCYPAPSLNEMSVSGCSIPVSLEGSAPPVSGNFSHSGNDLERFEVSARFTGDAHFDLLSYPETLVFSGNVAVYDASNPILSFAAGSQLRFLSNASLRIGYNTIGENNAWRGRLDIQGTALNPVILRADDGVEGSWKGLEFWGSTDLDSTFSTISHCRIQEADYGIYCGGTSEPSVITALEIQNCEGAGLRFDRCYPAPSLNEMSVSACRIPVSLEGSAPPELGNFSHSGNELERFEVSGHFESDASFDLANYPEAVVFSGHVYVYSTSNPTLSFSAGSQLRFLTNSSLRISQNTQSENNLWRGQLSMTGTVDEPVILRADDLTAEPWDGLTFYSSSDYNGAHSSLSHVHIQDAETGLSIRSCDSLSFNKIQLNNCSVAGLSLDESHVPIHDFSITDNQKGIVIDNSLITFIGDTLYASNSFTGNTNYDIENLGVGDVYARYNHWCPPSGQTLAQRIWDQEDDAAVGVVYYNPFYGGDVPVLMMRYQAPSGLLRLGWCSTEGALNYQVHASSSSAFVPDGSNLILTTADTFYDFAPASAPVQMYYQVVAILP